MVCCAVGDVVSGNGVGEEYGVLPGGRCVMMCLGLDMPSLSVERLVSMKKEAVYH